LNGGQHGYAIRMERLKRMTQAAHYGSRAKLAERIERPIAKRTSLSMDTLRSIVGGFFLLLAARRVARALRAGLR
jgi:hypothetical protein